jgi:hypothetical protein
MDKRKMTHRQIEKIFMSEVFLNENSVGAVDTAIVSELEKRWNHHERLMKFVDLVAAGNTEFEELEIEARAINELINP